MASFRRHFYPLKFCHLLKILSFLFKNSLNTLTLFVKYDIIKAQSFPLRTCGAVILSITVLHVFKKSFPMNSKGGFR